MNKIAVKSSNIAKVGWENNILEVEFVSGGSPWQYLDCPEEEYHNMIKAPSIGKYFLKNIRNNYKAKKVG